MSDLEYIEIASNPSRRLPCVLLLDNSYSMQSDINGLSPIEKVNRGLEVFEREIKQDSVARKSVEIAVITFGGEVETVSDFTIARKFTAPVLEARGVTPMGQALMRSIQVLENRKSVFCDHGVEYYRPWVFLFTDGHPTDDMVAATDAIVQAQKDKKLMLFCVGAGGADFRQLAQLAPERDPIRLKSTTKFAEMFQWLSSSLTDVSKSKPGEGTRLESVRGWGHVGI